MEDRIVFRSSLGLMLSAIVITMLLWTFAFLRMPTASPEWLIRAQAVCFGTNETGLPDASGWTILILSPLSLISALYITYADDLFKKLRELLSYRVGRILIFVLSIVVLAEGSWVTFQIHERLQAVSSIETKTESLPSNYPRTSNPAVEFSLVEQTGKRVALADFKGRPVLISFVFAHCQSVCPVLVKTLKDAHQLAIKSSPVLLLITLDPWRDTPESLPSLAKEWELASNEYVLSGSVAEVEQIIKSYGVPTSRDLKSGDVVHPALVYIIDRNGNLVFSFNNPTSTWIKEAIERL